MPRKKKIENKPPVQAPVKKKRELRPEEVRKQFKQYFIKLKRKLNIKNDMEQILWVHCKAIGCDKQELFDKGVENFGYKV